MIDIKVIERRDSDHIALHLTMEDILKHSAGPLAQPLIRELRVSNNKLTIKWAQIQQQPEAIASINREVTAAIDHVGAVSNTGINHSA